MTKPKHNENSESKTFDVRLRSGRRARITMRVKPELKEQLLRFCQKNGLSMCHVFELLATGYLVGVQQKINFDVISPTINLTVVREVKRIRRYKREFVEELTTEDVGSRQACAVCGERSVVVVFIYPSRSECVSTYLCSRHWAERQLKRDYQGFRLL